MLQNFIYSNYATCLIVLFMITFLLTNTTFDRKETGLFLRAVLFAVVLVIVDTVESWTAGLDHPTMLRIWMSAIGYTFRPLCILCILQIVVRNWTVQRFLLFFPAIANAIISFSALFTDVAYSYDENNEFIRGPLGLSAFIVSGIYLLIFIVYSIRYFREKNYHEALIVFAIALAAVTSVILEILFGQDGLINATIVISVTFYYLFFHTQTFKRDHLTKALNRRSFYLDAAKYRENISAVISIDLNFLKKINDTQGHDAGDKALCTLTDCVDKCLLKGCFLYRIGGDEFTVICLKKTKSQLEEMIADIKTEMAKTDYRCAIGLAMYDVKMDFDALCARADKAMYEDKVSMKAERKDYD